MKRGQRDRGGGDHHGQQAYQSSRQGRSRVGQRLGRGAKRFRPWPASIRRRTRCSRSSRSRPMQVLQRVRLHRAGRLDAELRGHHDPGPGLDSATNEVVATIDLGAGATQPSASDLGYPWLVVGSTAAVLRDSCGSTRDQRDRPRRLASATRSRAASSSRWPGRYGSPTGPTTRSSRLPVAAFAPSAADHQGLGADQGRTVCVVFGFLDMREASPSPRPAPHPSPAPHRAVVAPARRSRPPRPFPPHPP